MDFPICKTKIEGLSERFDLNDLDSRRQYFQRKVGKEIDQLRQYFRKDKSFVAYLLGKKNSGKGTYSKMFMEIIGDNHVGHVAIGDVVREVHKDLETEEGKRALMTFLRKKYRGFHTVEETVEQLLGRSQSKLISSELIVALIEYEISERPRQAIFVDGFPRAHDQIGYALYLKELIGYRDDPDFFIFINVPDSIIDERIKYRVVCPRCHAPRNLKLLATRDVGYDVATKEFYLMCDNPSCKKARMLPKEGDELGIEPIRERLEVDNQIFAKLLGLSGVPKIYLRNSIPVDAAAENVDDYEITPAYTYELLPDGKVKTIEKPWVIKDDEGRDAYSLLPPAVVVSLIKQVVQVLGL